MVGNFINNGSTTDAFPADITDVVGSVTTGTAGDILNPTLADNGGQTRTHALADGSPAIDSGVDADALGVDGFGLSGDQRGRARIVGMKVDVGAFEVAPAPGFTVTNPVTSTLDESGSSVSLTVVLDAPPAGSVALDISSSDETESKPRFASVSFGPSNWNVPQTVPIDSVADGVDDGDQPSTILVSVNAQTSDEAFDDLLDHQLVLTTTNIDLTVAHLDFGDAPTSAQSGFASAYPVTLAQDGARHTTGSLFLGGAVDPEADGVPTADASGDGSDEDGVTALASLIASATSTTVSSFAIVASTAGKLDAWIDFNTDGDWDDSGEQIFTSVDVLVGATTLSYTIPAGASVGSAAARFRLSTAGGLAPTGAAADGEVEDYITTLEAASNNTINVTSITPGTVTIETSGDDVIVREGDLILFQGPTDSLAVLDFTGTDGDDTVLLTASLVGFSGGIGFNAGGGTDTLNLTGENQELDISTLPADAIIGVEVIDIRGSGENRLKLSESIIAGLPDAGTTLKVFKDADDTLDLADGDFEINDSLIENGQFFVVAQSAGATTLHLGGLTWTNPLDGLDVNGSGDLTALDALQIINQLSRRGFVLEGNDTLIDPQELTVPFPLQFYDTSVDGNLTALDALRVINGLARRNFSNESPGGEAIAPLNSHPSNAELDEAIVAIALGLSEDNRSDTLPRQTPAATIAPLAQIDQRLDRDQDDDEIAAIDQSIRELLL